MAFWRLEADCSEEGQRRGPEGEWGRQVYYNMEVTREWKTETLTFI